MPALLALIPPKAIPYILGVLVLLGAFGWYTVHERNVQHAKDVAAAAAIVKKDNTIVAADDSHAQTTEAQNALIYKQAIAIPAVADIGLVCQHAARSVSLPAAGAVATAAVGNDAANRGIGPEFDISGAALTRAREADDEIKYLQARIAELEKQMNDAP